MVQLASSLILHSKLNAIVGMFVCMLSKALLVGRETLMIFSSDKGRFSTTKPPPDQKAKNQQRIECDRGTDMDHRTIRYANQNSLVGHYSKEQKKCYKI